MNLEFLYSVVSITTDGNRSVAKFTNARSAYMWANRLREEEVTFEIHVKVKQGVEFAPLKITIADLKKDAGTIKATSKKRKKR